jgi:hypothetical protein
VHRRETLLAQTILPGLHDLPTDQSMPWSIFDLHCVAPARMKLAWHRLNAGDLGLTFQDKRRFVTIRQIALAGLALKRLPMEKWLADQEQRRMQHYKIAGETREIDCGADDRELKGIARTMQRRRRFFFLRGIAAELVTAVFHDQSRDRLVIVQASDETLARGSALSCSPPGIPGEVG